MKRFFQVICNDIFDKDERKSFEAKCSCAVACGYTPCSGAFQMTPDISGSGDIDEGSGSLSIDTTNRDKTFIQSFCDQNGTATMICAHCTKCESCQKAPGSDVFCTSFDDKCYCED